MQHLSGTDNLFLEMEDKRQHMHIASLGVYDPATATDGEVRFKDILDFFSRKINELPLFRRRLVQAPLKLDRPYWVDDGEIDVEYHVRHIALPHPGDWRQLMIQVARIHSRPLDTSRPLWEAYVIGGLDNIEGIAKGSFALYIKCHHATMDGQAGAELIQVMHSLSPDYKPSNSSSVIYADREPNGLELILRGFGNRGKQVVNAAKLSAELGSKAIKLGVKYGPEILANTPGNWDDSIKLIKESIAGPSNHNRFDNKVSPHRVVDAFGISLADCKVIRQHLPVTINDIFMATAAGGLRHYLEHHNELPEDGLRALMPLAATGAQANAESANNISMAVVSIFTDIADPLERIQAIKQATNSTKDLQDDMGRDFFSKLNNVIPVSVAKRLNELVMQKQASVTLSNVRGPNIPLYLAGAKLQMFIPVSIPFDKTGVNITGFSYNNVLWVCSTACREMVPDPGVFTDCMRQSFAELVSAAKNLPTLADLETERGKTSTPKKTANKKTDSNRNLEKSTPKKTNSKRKPPKKKPHVDPESSNKAPEPKTQADAPAKLGISASN